MIMSPDKICLVSPFPPPYGGMAIQAEKMAYHMEKSGIRVTRVKTNATLPRSMIFFSRIPFLRTIVNLILFLTQLDKALKQNELVYFYSGFQNFFLWITLPAIILIKLRKKKIILSARGGNAEAFFTRYNRVVKPSVKRLDAVTAPSGFLSSVFHKFYKMDAIVVPTLADFNQFTFLPRKDFAPRLIATRNLEPAYDVKTIIQSFHIISKKYPDACLGIVGDGSQREELEHLVNELFLADKICFYGQVQHSRIQDIYNKYDIFINASKIDNLPGSILEAFASGLPVISTRSGGIPYMVDDGITGFLVDIGNYQELAAKVIHVIENPVDGRRMAKEGLKQIATYSWANIESKLFPLFDKVMQERP